MEATKVESVDENGLGIKVEGDLGDLQIIEELSDSDEEVQGDGQTAVATKPSLPDSLIRASTTPVFGSVAVTNSDNVQFGNNTFFNGPVTIKQVIQTSSGIDNASYQRTEDEKVPNGNCTAKQNPSSSHKFKIKAWHKLSLTAIAIVILCSVCAVLVYTQRGKESNDKFENADNYNASRHAQVTVECRDSVQIIIWVLLCVPITFLLWVFYSLLTNGVILPQRSHTKKEIPKCPTLICDKSRADDLLIAPNHLRIVPRTDWLAQPPEGPIDVMKHPTPWVIIAHTASEGCSTQSACVRSVRLIQMFHIESRGWSDIGYNFLIGGDGSAYYGRGWDQVGSHTKGYNHQSIGIAFIGTYNLESPTKYQIQACKNLIKLGVEEGKIAKDYKLFAHRQLMSTLSPGDKIFDIIKTWPHFVTNIDPSTINTTS